MRTTLSRLAVAAVIGATAAGVGTLYAATEPVQGTAYPAPTQVRVWPQGSVGYVEEDDPRWDCATMGNRVCGPQELGEETTINGRPWVVTVTGLEPVEEV